MSNAHLKVKMLLRQNLDRSEAGILYEVLDEVVERNENLDELLVKCMKMLTAEQIESLGIVETDEEK